MRALLVLAALLATTTAPAAPAAETPVESPSDVLLAVARAGGVDAARPDPSAVTAGTLRDGILDLYGLVGAVPTDVGLARLDRDLAALPQEITGPVARILAAMNEAARMRHEALADVTAEDARFAREATLRTAPLTPGEEARLAGILPKVDVRKMTAAAALVLAAIEAERPALLAAADAGLADDLAFTDPLGSVQLAGTHDDVHVGNRTLLVDFGGNDRWPNNAGASMPDFIIEAFPGCITTGGLDCTPLSKGRNDGALESVFGRPCGVELVEPAFHGVRFLEAADDEVDRQLREVSVPSLRRFAETTPGYAFSAMESTDADTRCVPKAADDVEPWAEDFLTRGILADGDEHVVALALDLAGDDEYAPDRVFNDINDGDNAAKCDTREMGEAGKLWERNLTAGSAFMGVGILWDEGGDDFYGGRSITQGSAHVGAVAALVDRGSGDDEYVAVRLAQGAGVFAAVALLYDDGGNDRYALENDVPFFNEFEHFIGCDVSTRDGQGRSNFNAIGAIVDLSGDDVYFVQQHAPEVPGASRDDPTTTQGSTGTRLQVGPSPVNGAAALGLGILWDRAGADAYSRDGRADGAFDPSGAFWDEE